MYIYDEKKDCVDVYEMKPKMDLINKYRKEQIKKSNVYRHVETVSTEPFNGSDKYSIFYPFKNHNEIIDISKVNFNGAIKKYERKGNLEQIYNDDIKTSYQDNLVINPKLVVIRDLEKLRYFLLDNKILYERVGELSANISYQIQPILEINKSLYILEQLLQRKFIFLKEEDFREELKFFDIILQDCISKLELAKISIYMDSTPSRVLTENSDNDQIILSKIKK